MALTGRQYQKLQEALLSAFPNRPSLAQVVRFGLDRNLDAIATGNQSQTIFELIEWAEAQGQTYKLIVTARNAAPENPELRKVSEELALAPPTPPRPDLEKLIRQTNSFLDVVKWREALARIEPTVCRIEIPTGQGPVYGTGFLLGSNAVMTNYHVVQAVIPGATGGLLGQLRAAPGDVVLRFDYKRLADGTTFDGTLFKLAAADWLIDSSPVDELDYALLRVDGTPGDDPVGGQKQAPVRGFLTPKKDHTFDLDSPLFIVQHPKGAPLQLALDTNAITGVYEGGNRVRYRTNTLPGSSGSPCFNANWELVALHHSGDPDFNPAYNEGIPFAAIMKLLEQRNVLDALGKQEM